MCLVKLVLTTPVTQRANLTLVSGGSSSNATRGSLVDNIATDEEKIRTDDKHQWMPVAKLGVSYHW